MKQLKTLALVALSLGLPAAYAQGGLEILEPSFWPDPRTFYGVSGGSVDASREYVFDANGNGCVGYVYAGADHELVLRDGFDYLRLNVESSGDTTLVLINRSTGDTYCDDDSGGASNPALAFENLARGVYEVRVGSYHEGEWHDYELTVTEYEDDWVTPTNLWY